LNTYQHLFFDLDKTIWDFDTNSHATLLDVYTLLNLKDAGMADFREFAKQYEIHNMDLWAHYREGKIEKEVLKWLRFEKTFNVFHYSNPETAKKFGKIYLEILPEKTALFPDSIKVLEYLYPKYHLHLITNGFDEVQFRKIENTHIAHYFKTVTTSDEAGAKKPDGFIFSFALARANAEKYHSLMIGDDLEVDIMGARDYGMDQVFFNHDRLVHSLNPTFEIYTLKELMEIL